MSEESKKEDMQPGAMPWTELVTNDKAASIKFYTELFGWTTEEMPLPGGKVYTTFNLGDRPVAGCVVPPEDSGALPMWLSYINVADLDASMEKSFDLGGRILKERVDLPMGSFAVVSGPGGEVFAFWEYAEACVSEVK